MKHKKDDKDPSHLESSVTSTSPETKGSGDVENKSALSENSVFKGDRRPGTPLANEEINKLVQFALNRYGRDKVEKAVSESNKSENEGSNTERATKTYRATQKR